VLGGGGVTGVAWELGLLTGLREAGVDLGTAELVVGTSAGAVVAAQLTSGAPPEQAYEAQLAGPGAEVAARMGWRALATWVWAMLTTRDPVAYRARIGRMALRTATLPEAGPARDHREPAPVTHLARAPAPDHRGGRAERGVRGVRP
jgi:NTE family protein